MASEWPKDEKTFLRWFWQGTNGNNLVKKLNNVPRLRDYIRRETYPPHIYGVVLNHGTFPFKEEGSSGNYAKLDLHNVLQQKVETIEWSK